MTTLNEKIDYAKENNYKLVQNFHSKELFGYWKSYVINVNGLLIEYHLALLVNNQHTDNEYDFLISVKESELVQKFDLILREEKISFEMFELLAVQLLKINLPLLLKTIY